MHLDDANLRDQGLAPPAGARGSVLILACGALAREILALKALNGWDHLDLQCLPAKLHLWPDRIPDAVEAAVDGGARPLRARSSSPMPTAAPAGCSRPAAPRSGSR